MSNKVLGIDLGTTNSAVAIIEDGQPHIIPVGGERLLPSVVGLDPEGGLLVGRHAYNQWGVSAERTVRSVKRLMGSGKNVEMAGTTYTPQEISAFILRRLREAAAAYLGEDVQRAVITVPAYFNEPQRQATIEAGEIAGLQVERILNEPTAAALAYGYGRESGGQPLRVLVYDLGGGTFDVSIIELDGEIVDVIATAGNNHLGGDDFDQRLADLLADEFERDHKIDLRQNHQAWARLFRAAEEAKIELSSVPYATVNLEYIASDKKGRPLHIQREIQREEFEGLISDLLDGTLDAIDQALTDANLEAGDLDRVLLVGGSTRIPAVWSLITEHLEREPHSEIDPDAAVALGAAVQAGIVGGEEIDAILVDVTPFSLGIETATFRGGRIKDDHFVPLIRRNTAVPVQKSEMFNTIFPGQQAIHVKVYQGESSVASQNVLLGDFMFDELKPNRSDGLTEVTVNFQLDINGILNVTVIDRAGRKQVSEQMKASRQRLSPEDIAQSQAKLSLTYADADETDEDEVVFDPGVHALLERAAKVLADPDVDPELAGDISDVMIAIREAAQEGDDEAVEERCDELIDLLFEAEE
ncbi:MAG: Hsp70 family protein [Caldilineaceae bacterium]|nr:Hsp70 family protein [Caldilineaceae bacterium]